MAKFGYTHRREMDPVPGRKFSTTYYKQNRKEQQRTKDHVGKILSQLGTDALSDPNAMAALTAPLSRFPRKETQGYYSALDIVTDMWEQMHSGKDIPSGMLGRWNKLFDGTGNELDMVPQADLPPQNNYNSIFLDSE